MIQPLKQRVVIKRDPTKTEITRGELKVYIPENARKPEISGVVLATGPDVKDIKVGDRVIFGKFDGQDLPEEFAEESCIIINEDQIKGIYV